VALRRVIWGEDAETLLARCSPRVTLGELGQPLFRVCSWEQLVTRPQHVGERSARWEKGVPARPCVHCASLLGAR
jgi:hypothetical protein